MRRPARLLILASALVAFCIACPSVRATVIYDNLADGNNGYFGIGSGTWRAQRFNSDTTNLILNAATLNLNPGTSGNFTLSLYSDSAGLPGVPVGTLFSGTKSVGVTTDFTGLNQVMLPNTNYWIVASVASTDATTFGWGVTASTAGTGSGFQTIDAASANQGATWAVSSGTQQMALVANTPEPASLALLVIGAAATTLRRKTKRNIPN